MLFIIFDVEAVFFYPWAVLLKQLKWFGLIEMLVSHRHPADRPGAHLKKGRARMGLEARRVHGREHPDHDTGEGHRLGSRQPVWPAQFGLACCAMEMIHTATASVDIARFGSEAMRASPRQSDLMIVSGRVSQKMAPILRTIYDQMPEPKWVISMGACASTGGVFNNYALLQGVDKVVPVDVYVPGCPPRPEDLLNALMILQARIKAQGITPRQ
jgi:NADH-quinone oxidoreductase subunit B